MEPIEKKIDETILDYKKTKAQLINNIQEKFQIQIGDNLLEEMLNNMNLRKMIYEIELNLSNHLNSKKIKSKNKMYFQKDWEVHEFLKIILLLKFENLSFERECDLWNEVIELLEKKINNLIESTVGDTREELTELKKCFYILLNFS